MTTITLPNDIATAVRLGNDRQISKEYVDTVLAPIREKKPAINGQAVAQAHMISRQLTKHLDKYRAKVTPQAALAGVTMLQAQLTVMLADITGKSVEDVAAEVTAIYAGMVPMVVRKT